MVPQTQAASPTRVATPTVRNSLRLLLLVVAIMVGSVVAAAGILG